MPAPKDPYSEVEEKVADRLRAGTRVVVVVDPRGETDTARPSEKDTAIPTKEDTPDGEDTVPGWRMPVAVVLR